MVNVRKDYFSFIDTN